MIFDEEISERTFDLYLLVKKNYESRKIIFYPFFFFLDFPTNLICFKGVRKNFNMGKFLENFLKILEIFQHYTCFAEILLY